MDSIAPFVFRIFRLGVRNPALDLEQEVEMAVQVSGKLLGMIQVDKGTPAAVVRAAIDVVEGVARYVARKRVVKVIHVTNRTLNFVVKS
jgi:leucyl-tRNA synthetase